MQLRNSSAVAICYLLAVVTLGAEQRRIPLAVNGRVPLGIENFRLEPAKADFYLIASAENDEFKDIDRIAVGDRDELVKRDGTRVKEYPYSVQFRISASEREAFEDQPWKITEKVSVQDLVSKLRFQVKVFHGLQWRTIKPDYVRDIGMPRDVSYNERIYQIGFTLGRVPIFDRVVLEVLSPDGQRLCKFHLDLT